MDEEAEGWRGEVVGSVHDESPVEGWMVVPETSKCVSCPAASRDQDGSTADVATVFLPGCWDDVYAVL